MGNPTPLVLRGHDGVVLQDLRISVKSAVAGNDLVGLNDVVFVDASGQCPENSIGFIREFGASGLDDLIVRVDLIKKDPMSWPYYDVWVFPGQLTKAFTEDWAKK